MNLHSGAGLKRPGSIITFDIGANLTRVPAAFCRTPAEGLKRIAIIGLLAELSQLGVDSAGKRIVIGTLLTYLRFRGAAGIGEIGKRIDIRLGWSGWFRCWMLVVVEGMDRSGEV